MRCLPSMTWPVSERMIGNERSASLMSFTCSTIARHVARSSDPDHSRSSSGMSVSATRFLVKSAESRMRRSTSHANNPPGEGRKKYCLRTAGGRLPELDLVPLGVYDPGELSVLGIHRLLEDVAAFLAQHLDQGV